ncbi:uncharacterized protein LOC131001436 [Salvia miltiorrhiza]|uniref:uncharacterized protein LOC131001436 n=1 Tax=Salvia miltiorrhiza TaxID=226208 RepID=UPI0025AD72AC|nr:uncharacterized protein LOC131001436 [Salvia miltiorrhiza]
MDHNCEVRIIKGKNIETKPNGVVFVRCYLNAGNGSRVRLDSKEIPSKSDSITWNQTFSLHCSGTQECFQQGTLVFELRRRSASAAPFISKIQGSRLIGRAEIRWEDVVGSTNMEVEDWVVLTPHKKQRVYDDIINPPTALQIGVKLRERCSEGVGRKTLSEERCGCNFCVDHEFFAIEAALEAL